MTTSGPPAVRRRRWGTALTALILLSGCSGPGNAPAPSASESAPAASTPAPAAGFTNPVYDNNFPDPMVIRGADGYVVVATNGSGGNVQTLTSDDLTTWEQGPDALPKVAKWSSKGKVWAPEVAKRADGRFVLYYTTRSPNPEVQCISAAVGTKAGGPYVDTSSKPLVCETKRGGSIDPSPFTAADGTRYLYWKNDGNAIGVDTWISGQRLDASGTKLVGKPKRLFRQDQDWEGNLVEAPFGWESNGKFSLFYSANDYGSDAYAVGQAIADDPLGPFTKSPEPVLTSNDVAAGPGHCALIEKDDKVWMVYHAWSPDAIGAEVPGRTLWLSEVTFAADGTATVVPPTVDYPDNP
jgi:beta-xylosidase